MKTITWTIIFLLLGISTTYSNIETKFDETKFINDQIKTLNLNIKDKTILSNYTIELDSIKLEYKTKDLIKWYKKYKTLKNEDKVLCNHLYHTSENILDTLTKKEVKKVKTCRQVYPVIMDLEREILKNI